MSIIGYSIHIFSLRIYEWNNQWLLTMVEIIMIIIIVVRLLKYWNFLYVSA